MICNECGMVVEAAEYHPYAACLMFKACHDGNVVTANLDAVLAKGYEMEENTLITDNATLRTALQSHAEEAAKLIQQRDELRDALMALLVAKDEKEYHGDSAVYQSLKSIAWKKARAAITRATSSTTTKEQ